MTLATKAHVKIGGFSYRLDQEALRAVNRSAYRHWTRSVFAGRTDISGRPGAQNLHPETLIWQQTDFGGGEGQVVMDGASSSGVRRFYRSEGLDFRVAGKFGLNRSSLLTVPPDGSAGTTATFQGDAWTDVSGTSTTVGSPADDRRINVLTNQIKSADHTGLSASTKVQADFYLYSEGQQLTTILGSALTLKSGNGQVSGTTFHLHGNSSAAISADITGLTAGSVYDVNLYAYLASAGGGNYIFSIWDVTNTDTPKLVKDSGEKGTTVTSLPSTPSTSLSFTAKTGKTYQFRVKTTSSSVDGSTNRPNSLVLDSLTYGKASTPADVLIEVYNTTTTTVISAKTVSVSGTTSAVIAGTLSFTAAATTTYNYRAKWTAGTERPIVDKVIATLQATSVWVYEAMELGLGGTVWLAASKSGVDSTTFTYDFATETWALEQAITGATSANIYALCHSDAYEYALGSDTKVYQVTTSTAAAYTAAITSAVGMCVAQDRLFVLSEGTTGVIVRYYAIDQAPPVAALGTATVSQASMTPDTTLRQQIVGTPDGARFFVNYSDITCRIYDADSSGSSLVYKLLAELDPGAKGCAISYSEGITYITGQFIGESGETPRSALWIIDQNGVLRRIGFFRYDAPVDSPPRFIQAFQDQLYILQGNYVWRWNLKSGGLYCEYDLDPGAPNDQRGLAVLQGHSLAAYATEGIWVTGSVGTYRSAAPHRTGGMSNQHISSVYDFGLPGVTKLLTKCKLLTDTMAAGLMRVKFEVQLDQSGTWVHIGTADVGAAHTFSVSTEASASTFNDIQTRITPTSLTGVYSPQVRAVIVEALPLAQEEFFDLVLRVDDEDSSDHIDGQQFSGGRAAANLWSLNATGGLVTFTDGAGSNEAEREYLVTVEDCDHMNEVPGEGRFVVRLRVLN